jgi:hypothetical protein
MIRRPASASWSVTTHCPTATSRSSAAAVATKTSSADYEIMFPNDAIYRGFLYQQLPAPPKTVGTSADIQALTVKAFERNHLLGARLPVDGWHGPMPGQWAADQFWQADCTTAKNPSFHSR